MIHLQQLLKFEKYLPSKTKQETSICNHIRVVSRYGLFHPNASKKESENHYSKP